MPVLESATEALASFVLTILFQPSLLSMGQADEGTLNRMLALAQVTQHAQWMIRQVLVPACTR